MHFGIEKHTGIAFEGMNAPEFPVQPRPAVSQCHLVQCEDDWKKVPTGRLQQDPHRWLFREDSFDPVTRIRRGRLYQAYGNCQPSAMMIPRHDSSDVIGAMSHPSTHRSVDMYRYIACDALLTVKQQGRGLPLVLGSGVGTAVFTILQVEALANGDVLLTLKARTAFGVIPDLNTSAVPHNSLKPVQQALERAVNSAFRETPISVVDQCRNALCAVLGHFLAAQEQSAHWIGKDLGQLVMRLNAREQLVCASAAHIVARLHPRGKSNEQHRLELREPVDEDAEFAVHALGLVMREIGWAN